MSAVEGPGPCVVSYEGFINYTVGPGAFPPIAMRYGGCSPGSGSRLVAQPDPPLPAWALPRGRTQALFVVVSFHEIPSRVGMMRLAQLAHRYAIPVTWMTGQPATFDVTGDLYDSYHRQFGDDLQTRPTNHNPSAESQTPTHFAQLAAQRFAWFRPIVAIEGSGYERGIASDISEGYRSFWGIAWNSHGLDNDYDEGTPWGAYCADPASYRRPARDGSCSLVGLEWTARDLTRAAISDHEEFYSTDPDDLQVAGFDRQTGAAYARALVDAYAVAGETQPLVMVVQQETDQMEHAPYWSDVSTSSVILDALYARAKADGMRAVTLSDAAARGQALRSAATRDRLSLYTERCGARGMGAVVISRTIPCDDRLFRQFGRDEFHRGAHDAGARLSLRSRGTVNGVHDAAAPPAFGVPARRRHDVPAPDLDALLLRAGRDALWRGVVERPVEDPLEFDASADHVCGPRRRGRGI